MVLRANVISAWSASAGDARQPGAVSETVTLELVVRREAHGHWSIAGLRSV